SVFTPVISFSKPPEGMIRVPPALIICWVISARPAGLKKMVDPSAQGDETPVPARPIAQVPCSYTPYPWATAVRGAVTSPADAPTANQTYNLRIGCAPGERFSLVAL